MSAADKASTSPRRSPSQDAFARADGRLKTIEDQTVEPLDISQDEVTAERSVTGLPWLVMILAILSSTFLYALDNTVMADVRPSIMDTFGHMDMLPWLSVSYPMGEVGANPLWFVLSCVVDHGRHER